jgi:hypothetical protein
LKQATTRRLGILFIIIGTILLLYGLVLLNTPIHCPAGGCPQSLIWAYSVPFLLGLSLTIIGIILFIASKLMKNDKPKI